MLIGGELVKTVPSGLTSDNLAELRMRGASPAGPPPATPALPAMASLPGGTVIEADRNVDANGNADLGGHKIPAGRALAGQRVTLRLDGHPIHVVADGVLARTLPSPVPASDRAKVRGARIATGTPPAPRPGPVSVQRKVPDQGVIMVTRQRLRVGTAYAGKIVTVYVEDTHFRVTCDGTEIALHPRKEQRPVTRWKAKIHAPKTLTTVQQHPRPSTMSRQQSVNQVLRPHTTGTRPQRLRDEVITQTAAVLSAGAKSELATR